MYVYSNMHPKPSSRRGSLLAFHDRPTLGYQGFMGLRVHHTHLGGYLHGKLGSQTSNAFLGRGNYRISSSTCILLISHIVGICQWCHDLRVPCAP